MSMDQDGEARKASEQLPLLDVPRCCFLRAGHPSDALYLLHQDDSVTHARAALRSHWHCHDNVGTGLHENLNQADYGATKMAIVGAMRALTKLYLAAVSSRLAPVVERDAPTRTILPPGHDHPNSAIRRDSASRAWR